MGFYLIAIFVAQPKGIQRPVGGHIATLCWSMAVTYGMKKNDVWWTASDLGWVVGHSYICYGPLLYGITSVMYEGKPDRTPDPGQYFRYVLGNIFLDHYFIMTFLELLMIIR